MPAHRRLPAVIGRPRRSKSFPNEVRRMSKNGCQASAVEVSKVFAPKRETGTEPGPIQSGKKLVKIAHGSSV